TPLVKTRTDAKGAFTFSPAPAGRFVVVALAANGDNRVARVAGMVAATTEVDGLALTTASTLVTTAVTEGKTGELSTFDSAAYARAVALTGEALPAGAAPDLASREAVKASFQVIASANPELGRLVATL